MEHINEAVIVSVDFSAMDTGVLIVGRKNSGGMTIINAIQGEEAWELYQRLIAQKK